MATYSGEILAAPPTVNSPIVGDPSPSGDVNSAIDKEATAAVAKDKKGKSPAKKRKKGGKPESVVWEHFGKYTDEDGYERAKCNYCDRRYYAGSKRNGTSSLKAHMVNCLKNPSNSGVKQSQLSLKPILEEGEGECTVIGSSLTSWSFDHEFCRKQLASMVIRDEFAFSVVDGEGFQDFVAALQGKFKMPSRWTVSRDIFKLYKEEKAKLRDFFKNSDQSVCITTDTWTSLQRINYMCITAHYVDANWKLTKKIINFCTIESHKGEDMGRQIDACLREWGIKRVFSVTVDNASSNDTCLIALRNKLGARGACLLGGKYLHMRCVAHIINLVVQDGLKEMDPSIKKIRDAIRFVRHSPTRIARFKECCKDENIESKSLLCLDVATRWNSTYLMLDVACKFEKAFDLFEVRDSNYKAEFDDAPPDFVDWENARKMSKMLQSFYDITNRVSGSLYVTSNTFLHEISNMSQLLKEWANNSVSEAKTMGVKMREKFDKYWGDPRKMNKIIFFSVIIDPRYKFDVVEYILETEYGKDFGSSMAKSVKEDLYNLYEAYKLMIQTPNDGSSPRGVTNKDSSTSSSRPRYILLQKFEEEKRLVDSSTNDLDVFLTEKRVMDSKTFDILNWWQLNHLRFPILSHLVRDVLAVPVSTVASESAFSTGGRVLDAFRSSLTAEIVESLLCAQDWLRKKKRVSLEEDLDAILKHEEALRSLHEVDT